MSAPRATHVCVDCGHALFKAHRGLYCYIGVYRWQYNCESKTAAVLQTQLLAPPTAYHKPVALGSQEADDLMLLNDIVSSLNRERR